MSIYIERLLEARAASRELRSTKGSEHSPITGKETRFVPTAKQEAGLSDKAKRKLASHKKRLAARTQDVASDAEEQSKAFKSGSSMKESLQRSLSRLFSEAKRFKHPKTAKFLAYRQGKQTEKASKELERTTRTPDKFEKKVDKLMGKKKYNTQTPSEMWREIHGNAKKGVEEYKGKRDAQERADAEREKRES